MRHPFIAFFTIAAVIFTHGQPNRRVFKPLIINEVKIGAKQFVEVRSEEANISLDGYYVSVIEYSNDRTRANEGTIRKVRGMLSLKGKYSELDD